MASILNSPAIQNAAVSITVPQYHLLGEAGTIDKNTELIEGVIVKKMVKSPEHSWLVHQLADWLRRHLPADRLLRQEQPLTFETSEPEPDLAVVAGSAADYRRRHPDAADLVIEVAISSEPIDREKARLYAAAGVSQYWLVLPAANRVEVFTQPTPSGYQQRQQVQGDATLASVAGVPAVTADQVLSGSLN